MPPRSSRGLASGGMSGRASPRAGSRSSSSGDVPLHETAKLDDEEYLVHRQQQQDDTEAQRSSRSPPLPLNPMLPLNQQIPVDARNSRFPYAIVWGQLPLLSWLLPCAGHLGITDSEGVVHDFAGPYYVETDSFMVTPSRYYQLSPEEMHMSVDGRDASLEERRALWDGAIQSGDAEFRQKMHNILCQNCHHHVSRCFAHMGVRMSSWQAMRLVMLRGKFVSREAMLCFFGPAMVIWGVVLVIVIVMNTARP